MTQRKPDSTRRENLRWKCTDLDCRHDGYCREKTLFSDDGFVQIRGSMTWNQDDGKWDWCVSVDYYGSAAMPDFKVEALASRHARKMASLVHPEGAALYVVDDDDVEG